MLEIDDAMKTLRSRLATELRLTQKQKQLASANSKIAAHARALTDEVIERREQTRAAVHEARELKGTTREALTELRRAKSDMVIAERRLWASLETIEDGFAVFDREGKVIAANNAFLTPFSDLEFVGIGTTYAELVELCAEEGLIDVTPRRPADWIRWMKARWDTRHIEPVTLRFFNNRFVRITERRTRDGDIVMLAINITKQMQRERQLEEARKRAEEASHAKSAFLANMSHEIRTPMNGVLAMADLLAEGELTEDQRLCLDTIRSSGEALLVIINDVLDYSKIEAEKLTLQRQPFDLEATISEVVTLLEPTARDKGVSLVLDYDMFLPTGFVGDKGRMRQVLMNLLGNAVKFTQEGHVIVRVVGLPAEEEGACDLHFSVEDTGIGISDEMQEHIFGEFNQVESTSTRQFDGTGLGLAITRKLVGLMGGELWLDSEIGKGSVFGFRVRLPVDGAPQMQSLSAVLQGRRAIIADPDTTKRGVLAKQLVALGLKPDPIDVVGDPARAGADDLTVMVEDVGPAGRVRIGLGAPVEGGQPVPSVTVHRPTLRSTLLGGLNTLAELAESGVPAEAPPEPAPDAPAIRMRVLAAEDNKTNQLVLKKLLKDVDIELEIANNGAEAVESYKANPPHLVLTDISMPVMDGREATRAIRAHEAEANLPRVPIVAMTAHALGGDEADILEAGVDHYLTKPLKKAVMIEHICAAAPQGATPVRDAD